MDSRVNRDAASTTATLPEDRHEAADRHVGLIGLAVMGENLALNIANNGFPIAVYNRTANRTEEFLRERVEDRDIATTFSIEEFVASLARPRRIILMVKAGEAVDAVVRQLLPHLQPGDIVIDGGNSFFQDTERRAKELTEKGLNFVGMGVSGGEEGALNGPSLMPGGPPEAYAELETMLVAISAKTDSGPCVTHIGPGGSGHYVKMVHNGIEYGDMQLIAETYDIMRRALGMDAQAMSDIFAKWNQGKLESYLIEVTAAVLAFIDVDTDRPLVDVILDQAEQKGTGRWTSQNAFELATPTPTIDAAVAARIMSSKKVQRVAASKLLHGPDHQDGTPNDRQNGRLSRDQILSALEDALYFAKVSSYAQGMALLHAASEAYGYGINLSEVARIWKGGCIIRAALLDPIREAFRQQPEIENLLLVPEIAESVNASMAGCRIAIQMARTTGIPCPALSASLDYVDTFRQDRLPANLVQGQRDFFGAHTYKRIDREGTFHTVWTAIGTPETVATAPSTRQAWAGGDDEGDRSPEGGAIPEGTDRETIAPADGDELQPDADTEGERAPESTDKAKY